MKNIDLTSWNSIIAEYSRNIMPYSCFEDSVKLAEQAISSLNFKQLNPVLEFKNQPSSNYAIITGLEPDPDLIPTIDNIADIENKKKTFYSEFALIMLAKVLGEPFSYAQEKNGALIHNVRPSKINESNISSDSSSIILDLHNENIYHPVKPDYLLLSGLRKDPRGEAKTLVIATDEIISKLSNDDIKNLMKFEFRTSVDFNFGNKDSERGVGPLIRVLYGNMKFPMIAYDDEYIMGINDQAQTSLDRLRRILHENMHEIELQNGEILLLDNLKTVHGRTPFKANYDGNDRWLQRLLVTRDLRQAELLLGETSRVISWNYKQGEYYGYIDYSK